MDHNFPKINESLLNLPLIEAAELEPGPAQRVGSGSARSMFAVPTLADNISNLMIIEARVPSLYTYIRTHWGTAALHAFLLDVLLEGPSAGVHLDAETSTALMAVQTYHAAAFTFGTAEGSEWTREL